MNIKYFRSFNHSIAVPRPLADILVIVIKWSTVRPNIMQYSCHYHLVIFLVIATVHYDILFDRVTPHALYVDSQPSLYVKGCLY